MARAEIESVVEFVLELEKLKAVMRKTRPIGQARYENSAEHSWQLALFALSLAPYAAQAEPERRLDLDRVVRMLLVHDLGEIDAGDVMVYDPRRGELRDAERAGAERVLAILPEPEGASLLALWREFDDGETAEARFAHAVDRAAPVLLNLANDGQSWRENGIRYEQVVARVGPSIRNGSPELWTHIEGRLAQADADGWFGTDSTSTR